MGPIGQSKNRLHSEMHRISLTTVNFITQITAIVDAITSLRRQYAIAVVASARLYGVALRFRQCDVKIVDDIYERLQEEKWKVRIMGISWRGAVGVKRGKLMHFGGN